jgi:hypothetical protein
MKIKLVNLIEGGVNTPASTPASTPATATSSANPSAPKAANWWDNWIPDAVKRMNNAGTVIGSGLGFMVGGVRGAIAGGAIGNEISGMVSGKQETNNGSAAGPAKNQEHTDRHKDYMARTQSKLERDRLARQAEIEAESHRARMSRIARSRTRIFEQQNLQFKSGTLKSLLEGGIVSDIKKYYIPSGNQNIKDTLDFYTNPKLAAKRFITATTPQPGDDEKVSYLKSLVGLSPVTWAKVQAGKAASAAAFDPTVGAEKIKHYANIIQTTDPVNILSTVSRGIGNAAQLELRNRLYYGFGDTTTRSSPLNRAGLGTLGTVAGLAGGVGGLVTPYTQARATVAGKIAAAQKDDWRYAALPN